MDAILLAAGNSVRFGGNKLLYRLDGKPMYRFMLELLAQQKEAGVLGHVVVVSQYEEIFSDIKANFYGIEAVRNPAPQLGISGSVKLGLTRLGQVSADSDSCLFTVADQPCFTVKSFQRLVQLWETHRNGIVAASDRGQIKNPVIFAAGYYGELKSLEGDTGGRQVLRRHMDDVGLCELPAHELADVDTADAAGGCRGIGKQTGA